MLIRTIISIKSQLAGLITIMLFLLSSCITVKDTLDLNDTPLSVGNGSATTIINSLGNDNISISGLILLEPFTYKFEEVTNGKRNTTFIKNKKLNAIAYGLENITLNSSTRNDSLYISPKGDYAGIVFNRPIIVQKNRLRAKLKKITIKTDEGAKDNIATMKLRLNPFSLISRHAKKLNASEEFPSENIRDLNSDIDIDMIGIAQEINYELTKMGDVVPGWGARGYVLGPTNIISASGRKLMIGTRVRAEQWKKLPFGGKTRLWRQTTNAHVEVEMVDNPNGNPYLRVVSANIRHFPGDFEQIIIRQVNKKLKEKGLNLDFPGFKTELRSLEFTKLDQYSINVKAKAEFKR